MCTYSESCHIVPLTVTWVCFRLCFGLYRERRSLAWVNTNIFDYNRNMKHQVRKQSTKRIKTIQKLKSDFAPENLSCSFVSASLCMGCPLYHLSFVTAVFCISCPMYQLSFISAVLCISCPLHQLFFVSAVHCISCPLHQLTFVTADLCISCPFYQLSFVSAVLCISCPLYQLSCVSTVLCISCRCISG